MLTGEFLKTSGLVLNDSSSRKTRLEDMTTLLTHTGRVYRGAVNSYEAQKRACNRVKNTKSDLFAYLTARLEQFIRLMST